MNQNIGQYELSIVMSFTFIVSKRKRENAFEHLYVFRLNWVKTECAMCDKKKVKKNEEWVCEREREMRWDEMRWDHNKKCKRQ